jgi:hypothetical protein
VNKNDRTLWQVTTWCMPPQAHAACVSHMEDGLQVSHWPYARRSPVVWMDAASQPLLGEVNTPWPRWAGRVTCEDYASERNGVCHPLRCCEPLRGGRPVGVTARRTTQDWAACSRAWVDVHDPEATRMRVVLANLNTHTGASLYEAFPPHEARRLLDRLELHHTPKHASWLHMAEIERGV